MSWRHINNQPLQLSIDHALKGICHDAVMFTLYERGPHFFHKGNKSLCQPLPLGGLVQILKEIEYLFLLLDGE